MRTWPAIYQMLPAWIGSVRSMDSAGVAQDEPTNLLQDAPWAGQALVPSLLARARATREYLRAPWPA